MAVPRCVGPASLTLWAIPTLVMNVQAAEVVAIPPSPVLFVIQTLVSVRLPWLLMPPPLPPEIVKPVSLTFACAMWNTARGGWFGSMKRKTRVPSHQPPAIVRSLLIEMLLVSRNAPAPTEMVSPAAASATAWLVLVQGSVAVQLAVSLPDVLT